MKNNKVVVLGAGMVGRAMAIDMAKDTDVLAADISASQLAILEAKGIATVQMNLSDAARVKEVIADADLVIGAVPGYMGF